MPPVTVAELSRRRDNYVVNLWRFMMENWTTRGVRVLASPRGRAGIIAGAIVLSCTSVPAPEGPSPLDQTLVASGKTTFRHDTYGDETFWTDTLHLNQVIQGGV